MHKYIVTLLILLMTALPVWSATVLCHHEQGNPAASQTMPQGGDHHCCLDQQQLSDGQTAADTCHCDQFQHAQFILSLPVTLTVAPASHFIPPALPLPSLPERVDLLYRPPIA